MTICDVKIDATYDTEGQSYELLETMRINNEVGDSGFSSQAKVLNLRPGKLWSNWRCQAQYVVVENVQVTFTNDSHNDPNWKNETETMRINNEVGDHVESCDLIVITR